MNREAAVRRAFLARLVSGLGHEISNPLTYVLANTELARRDLGALSEDVESAVIAHSLGDLEDMLRDVQIGAERIARVMEELRWLLPERVSATGRLDVATIVHTAISQVEKLLYARAVVKLELGAMPPVRGDGAALARAMANVLSNAAQAIDGSPAASSISITGSIDASGSVIVTVTDSGRGIPEADRARLFEPFFTTKPMPACIGLGLAVAQAILLDHGGDIRVSSHEPRGTRVEMSLPAME
jgi:signal transduction histidine kinase